MNPEEAKKLINQALELNQSSSECLEQALLCLDDEEPVDPDEGGEEEDEYFGGPPGVGGKRVIENKTYDKVDLEEFENTDLLNCTFHKHFYDLTLPPNLRLLSCVFEGINPPDDEDHIFYVNNGHKEKQIAFVMDDCEWRECNSPNFAEFKASELYMFRCRQHESCKIGQTIRQRHGRMLVIEDCEGFKEIALRGWGHWVKKCPGSSIVLWAGNLPARHSQWEEPKEQGKGNYQCSELVYVDGVGPINLGKKSVEGDNPYPALDCIIGPNRGQVNEGLHKSTDYETMESYLDLWDICNLQPTIGHAVA